MKLIGMKRVNFKAQDGKQIDGYTLYLSYPLTDGSGVGVIKEFLSNNKFVRIGFPLEVGKEYNCAYNRFGKIETIIKG